MNKKQNNWQRLESVILWANMSANYFARYIGLAHGENIYQIKRGNNGISLNLAERIIEKFPQIDKLWLLTGEGSMFTDPELQGAGVPYYNVSVDTIRELDSRTPDDCLYCPMAMPCDFAINGSETEVSGTETTKTVLFFKKN